MTSVHKEDKGETMPNCAKNCGECGQCVAAHAQLVVDEMKAENAKLRAELVDNYKATKYAQGRVDELLDINAGLERERDAAILQVSARQKIVDAALEARKNCTLPLMLTLPIDEYVDSTEKPLCEKCARPDLACEEHGTPIGVSRASGPGFCGQCLAVMPCNVHAEKRNDEVKPPTAWKEHWLRAAQFLKSYDAGSDTFSEGWHEAANKIEERAGMVEREPYTS